MSLTKQQRKHNSNLAKTRRENSKPLGVFCETVSSIVSLLMVHTCWRASNWVAWSCVPLLQDQSISPMLDPCRQKAVCVQASMAQPCMQAQISPRAARLFRSLLLDLYTSLYSSESWGNLFLVAREPEWGPNTLAQIKWCDQCREIAEKLLTYLAELLELCNLRHDLSFCQEVGMKPALFKFHCIT